MNYINLWDNFKEVCDHWNKTKKFLDEYASFLSERSKLDTKYAAGLLKLADHNVFKTCPDSFESGLRIVQNFYVLHGDLAKTLAENVFGEGSETIKRVIAMHDFQIKDKIDNAKRLISEREKTLKNHDKAREKYIKSMKDSTIAPKNHNNPIKFEDISTKSYMTAIQQANTFNIQYMDGIKLVLGDLYSQESDKLRNFKDSFNKIVAFETCFLKNLQYEMQNLPTAIESFEPEHDLKVFAQKINSGKKIEVLTFQAYNEEPSSKRYQELRDSQEEEHMRKVLESCWNEDDISDEELEFFYKLIEENQGRRLFTGFLNEKRNKQMFTIPSKNFRIVGELIRRLLNSLMQSEDLACAKQCIILSQTFYEETLNKKNYLQNQIMSHPF